MGIDDESSHPELCSEIAGGVTRTIVCLFREPDAGDPPVRFDEREQETEAIRRVQAWKTAGSRKYRSLRKIWIEVSWRISSARSAPAKRVM